MISVVIQEYGELSDNELKRVIKKFDDGLGRKVSVGDFNQILDSFACQGRPQTEETQEQVNENEQAAQEANKEEKKDAASEEL